MSLRRWTLTIAALVALISSTAIADEPKPVGEAISLFNGRDFDGWTKWIQHAKTDPQRDQIAPDNDHKGVFKVEDGLIHVSGEEFGCLTTAREFENYHLTVEFKWGERRWPPRENAKRDSGILLHCTGPDKVWTKSIECQIQEGDCGDFWLVDGTSITVDGKVEKSYKKKTTDAEKPTGQWNTIEVICDGGKITNIVNGVVVNEGTHASVTRGKILLQSEGAEVYYRKVELKFLKK